MYFAGRNASRTSVSLLIFVLSLPVARRGTAQKESEQSKQSIDALPAFEVASIRVANREDGRRWFGVRLTGARFETSAESLKGLVAMAYFERGKSKIQVTTDRGTPAWVSADQFDIEAKIEDAELLGWEKLSPSEQMDRVRPMLQQLLLHRFHLTLETTVRVTPVYVLVLGRHGAKFQEAQATDTAILPLEEGRRCGLPDHSGIPVRGTMRCGADGCVGHAVGMGQIAASVHADRIVIDHTGLTGSYNVSFAIPPANDPFPMRTIEDELGLYFKPRSLPMKTYVIRAAEKPSLD